MLEVVKFRFIRGVKATIGLLASLSARYVSNHRQARYIFLQDCNRGVRPSFFVQKCQNHHIVVGLSRYRIITTYKRPPVLSVAQRCLSLLTRGLYHGISSLLLAVIGHLLGNKREPWIRLRTLTMFLTSMLLAALSVHFFIVQLMNPPPRSFARPTMGPDRQLSRQIHRR